MRLVDFIFGNQRHHGLLYSGAPYPFTSWTVDDEEGENGLDWCLCHGRVVSDDAFYIFGHS